ncbi:MAG: polyprenyl diphosphate synthase, partial [Candidatus Vogelbacteria bacterium]
MNQIRTIGIIMDGNRRWAKQAGLPAVEGHRRGAEKFREVLKWSREAGINTVVAYAFSAENWQRKKLEVNFLFKLFRQFLKTEVDALIKDKTIFRCIGGRDSLPKDLQLAMAEAETRTKNLGPLTLVVAVAYGGRAEIVSAAKVFAERYKGNLKQVGESEFEKCLWTAGLPDPDLIIRTGGA